MRLTFGREERDCRAARTFRKRQDDRAAARRGIRDPRLRPGRRRGRRRHESPAGAPALRHGLPALCPLPAHDGRRERRLRPRGPEAAARGRRAPRCREPRGRGPPGLRAAPHRGDLRRPAAARRAGARPGAPTPGAPLRRAALQPRSDAARAHAARVEADHPARRHHDGLRHARAGGGVRPGRPGGGHERRTARAGRVPGGALRGAGDPLRGHVRRPRERPARAVAGFARRGPARSGAGLARGGGGRSRGGGGRGRRRAAGEFEAVGCADAGGTGWRSRGPPVRGGGRAVRRRD